MKTSPAIKGEPVKRSVVMALAAKDKRAYTSHFKREPKSATEAVVAKYTMIGGVPHKAVNGALVPLTKKA